MLDFLRVFADRKLGKKSATAAEENFLDDDFYAPIIYSKEGESFVVEMTVYKFLKAERELEEVEKCIYNKDRYLTEREVRNAITGEVSKWKYDPPGRFFGRRVS